MTGLSGLSPRFVGQTAVLVGLSTSLVGQTRFGWTIGSACWTITRLGWTNGDVGWTNDNPGWTIPIKKHNQKSFLLLNKFRGRKLFYQSKTVLTNWCHAWVCLDQSENYSIPVVLAYVRKLWVQCTSFYEEIQHCSLKYSRFVIYCSQFSWFQV